MMHEWLLDIQTRPLKEVKLGKEFKDIQELVIQKELYEKSLIENPVRSADQYEVVIKNEKY